MNETKLTMNRGDSQEYTVLFKNSAGAAYDITGWTVTFTVKINKTDPDASAVVRKIVTTHTNPATGTAIITLLPADTDALEARGYWYDIQVKTLAGEVYTVLKGVFILEYDVSRAT